jgi:hypothetical protein
MSPSEAPDGNWRPHLGRIVELRCPEIYVAHEFDRVDELNDRGESPNEQDNSSRGRIDLNKS